MTLLSLFGARRNAALGHFDDERTFGAVAHVDLRPIAPLERGDPLINACPRAVWFTAASRVSRRVDLQISHLRIGRNGQQVTLVQITQIPAKPGRMAHFVVACDPRMRQLFAMLLEHFQAELMPRAKANFLGMRLMISSIRFWIMI